MIAKCGIKRLRHWAHVSTTACDHWWEPETEWHRAWKNLFPTEWQEVHHRATDGEVHIADVKTANGTVIEFQHSSITGQEKGSREAFYGSMVWIVNGNRLKRYLSSFRDALIDAPSTVSDHAEHGTLGQQRPRQTRTSRSQMRFLRPGSGEERRVSRSDRNADYSPAASSDARPLKRSFGQPGVMDGASPTSELLIVGGSGTST
jgi:hypothetical protein